MDVRSPNENRSRHVAILKGTHILSVRQFIYVRRGISLGGLKIRTSVKEMELVDLGLCPFVLDVLPPLLVLQRLPGLPVLLRDLVHDASPVSPH